jgi:hypothetical protein
MMRAYRSWPLGPLLLVLVLASPAWADGYDAAVARAAAARDRALETDSAKDWQEALELFGAAIEFNPTMEAKFEYAEAAVRLKLDDEAFGAYADALELGIAGRARERALAFVGEHEHTLGRLALEGPAGARVYIDERKRGTLPLGRAIPLAAGAHRLHVDATDYRPLEREIEVAADQTTNLTLALERAWIPPVAAQAGSPPPIPAKADTAAPSGGWVMPVMVGGGALFVGGVVTIIGTSTVLTSKRADLDEECAVVEDDACQATTATHVSTAQSIGNDIMALKNLRWVGVGAAVVGAGAVGVGLFELASRSGSTTTHQSARLEISGGFTGVRWQRQF